MKGDERWYQVLKSPFIFKDELQKWKVILTLDNSHLYHWNWKTRNFLGENIFLNRFCLEKTLRHYKNIEWKDIFLTVTLDFLPIVFTSFFNRPMTLQKHLTIRVRWTLKQRANWVKVLFKGYIKHLDD